MSGRESGKDFVITTHFECGFLWGQLEAHEVLACLHTRRGEHISALTAQRVAEALRARVYFAEELLRPFVPDE